MIFSVHHLLGFILRFRLHFFFLFQFGEITQLPCMAGLFRTNSFYLEIRARLRTRRTTTICDWFICPMSNRPMISNFFLLILAFFIFIFIRRFGYISCHVAYRSVPSRQSHANQTPHIESFVFICSRRK